jgi:hypothetical protein
MTGAIVRFLGILIIAATTVLHGQTVISGDLSKFTLDSTHNPYVVDTTVEVPADKSVIIGEGCVFLFMPFSGINVYGTLTVNGTAEHPVIFTAINDSLYNHKSAQPANPFDWNGLYFSGNSGGSLLKNFTLTYSTYGIKSQSDAITVVDGAFRHNGQFHFTINDKIQFVQENFFFSYSKPPSPQEKTKGDTLAPLPAPAGEGHYRTVRWIRRIAFGALAVGCGAAGAVFNQRSNGRYDDYRANSGFSGALHDGNWRSVTNAELTRNIFYAAGGVFFAAFVVSITF